MTFTGDSLFQIVSHTDRRFAILALLSSAPAFIRGVFGMQVFERVGPSCNWWAQYEIFGPPPSLSAFFFLQVLVSYVVHAVVSSDRALFCY
jgi:hypothetical protein